MHPPADRLPGPGTAVIHVLEACALLDATLGTPFWVHLTPRPDDLDLTSGYSCVLASLFTGPTPFTHGIDALRPTRDYDLVPDGVFAINDPYFPAWNTVLTRLRRERPLPACPHPDALQHLHYEYQPPFTHARRVPTSTACQDCCDALMHEDAQRAIGDYRENPHLYSRHPITLPDDHPLAQALRNSSTDPDDYEDLDLNDLP